MDREELIQQMRDALSIEPKNKAESLDQIRNMKETMIESIKFDRNINPDADVNAQVLTLHYLLDLEIANI